MTMKPKIEVTDEMLDVAAYRLGVSVKDLHAALNPPPEPEIVVTDEQTQAGYNLARMWVKEKGCVGTSELYCMAKDIYRAMRKLEPKAEPFVAHAVPAPGQPWVRGLHYDWREMRKWGSGSGSGNCDR